MLKMRLIPVLYIKNGLIVRSEDFSYHQNIGNVINEASRYNEWDVDELIYIDISREGCYDLRRDDHKIKSSTTIDQIIEDISQVCFMPLTIGGGGAWRGIVSEILISEITISSMSMSPAPQITWTAIPNMTYEIQYTTPDQIIAGTWTPLGLRTPTTSTGEYTDLAVGGDASRLYRVVLVPTP